MNFQCGEIIMSLFCLYRLPNNETQSPYDECNLGSGVRYLDTVLAYILHGNLLLLNYPKRLISNQQSLRYVKIVLVFF